MVAVEQYNDPDVRADQPHRAVGASGGRVAA
jgi:hypothetical protein